MIQGLWSAVSNGWAILAALLLSLVLGLYTGYEISQPVHVSEPTRDLLARLDKVETLLVSAQVDAPRDLSADLAKLGVSVREGKQAAGNNRELLAKLARIDTDAAALEARLRAQNLAYDRTLTAELAKLREIRAGMTAKLDASDGIIASGYDQLRRFLKWIGAVSFLTIIGVLGFLLLMRSPKFRARIARSGSISAFGVSVNFSDPESVRQSVEVRQRTLDDDIAQTYAQAMRAAAVYQAFEKAVRAILKVLEAQGVTTSGLVAAKFRATLFVPGFVGDDLIQAAAYFDGVKRGSEGTVGRRFSSRFGIIGKAMRLQKSVYNAKVENVDDSLIREWGFTRTETKPFEAGVSPVQTKSLMALVFEDVAGLPPLGIIYLDASGENCFHEIQAGVDMSDWKQAEAYAASIWSAVDDKAKTPLRSRLVTLRKNFSWNEKLLEAPGR